jgi:(5-formylfuran-3-yl)methyl phosphate synthase
MTLMLANVFDAAEAEVAAEAGVNLVDFSDPGRGPVGNVRFAVIAKGVEAIAGRARPTAALGDPPYETDALIALALKLRKAKVRAVRFAVTASDLDRMERALKGIAHKVDLVGVTFADREPDFALIPRLANIGFTGFLLDVAEKGGRLLDHAGSPKLAEFCRLCRDHNINAALAGSLQAPDVPRLLHFENPPRILCFRSALRVGGRSTGALDPRKIALIRDLIPPEAPEPATKAKAASKKAGTAAAAGKAKGGKAGKAKAPAGKTKTVPRTAVPAPARKGEAAVEEPVDAVFVRDVIASAYIGAYAHERGKTQRVRFDVEASVLRVHPADDMRAIFSYDVILDAISLVTGRDHVDFLETLAEDVATIVLKDERVARVRVRLEKLDVIPGAVGVEITRDADPRSSGGNPRRMR